MPEARNIQTPDIGANILSGFTAGRQFGEGIQKRNALADIGQQAAGGDLTGARQAALGAGEFDTAAQIDQMLASTDDKQREALKQYNEDLTRAAFWADTPKKWEQAVAHLVQIYPSQSRTLQGASGQFQNREAIIASGLSINQQISRQKAQQPSLEQIFDPTTGQPLKALIDAEGNVVRNVGGAKAPSGTELTVDPDTGEVTFRQGSGVGLQKSTRGKIETKVVDTSATLDRLNQISASFEPRFQQIATRGEALFASLKAKGGVDLSQDERQLLTDFADFKRDALDNLNQTLKELSGAAVSDQEFNRVSKSLPNPGTGLFDGDDPVSFQAKLDDSVSDTRRALARYNFWLRNGLGGDPWDVVPLDQIDALINRRGEEIMTELRQGAANLSEEDLEAQTLRQLEQEFGRLN